MADFLILKNQTVGMNLATFPEAQAQKAWEIAEHLGMKEAACTKYVPLIGKNICLRKVRFVLFYPEQVRD